MCRAVALLSTYKDFFLINKILGPQSYTCPKTSKFKMFITRREHKQRQKQTFISFFKCILNKKNSYKKQFFFLINPCIYCTINEKEKKTHKIYNKYKINANRNKIEKKQKIKGLLYQAIRPIKSSWVKTASPCCQTWTW